tara:strand:- start:9677 stop:10396 length:720 start_codon:yes stop_codon:yes gene_type:complete
MAFSYYKIGRDSPTPTLLNMQAPRGMVAMQSSIHGLGQFGRNTRKAVEATRIITNLATRNKGASWRDYHQSGVGGVGGVEKPLVAWPGFLDDQLLQLATDVDSLNRDILSAIKKANADGDVVEKARLTKFALNSWNPFVVTTTQFIRSNNNRWSLLWGSLYSSIMEKRAQLIGFHKIAKRLDVQVTSPTPEMPISTPGIIDRTVGAVGGMLKTVMYFVLGGVLLWLVVSFAPKMLARGA